MEEQEVQYQDFSRIRDVEERVRLLKDRALLIGQTLVDEREKTSKEILEIKKSLMIMKEENTRIKEVLERVTEQLGNVSRKDELIILQRQFDLLRK